MENARDRTALNDINQLSLDAPPVVGVLTRHAWPLLRGRNQGRVAAQVEVAAKVAVGANDVGQHKGGTRVAKFGRGGKCAHVDEFQEIALEQLHRGGQGSVQGNHMRDVSAQEQKNK